MNACPIERWARTSPDSIALIAHGRTWTYREAHAEVTRVEHALREFGVRAGDAIAALGWNSAEAVFAFHAAGRVRAIWVPLNARLTTPERDALLERVQPTVTLDSAGIHFVGRKAQPRESPSVRAILFTSGTSGVPKGAELTFANFEANATASARNLGGEPGQRWLLCMPMFHIGGLAMVNRCAVYGASLVLHERFDPHSALRSLREDGITHASVVATQLQWILETDHKPAPSTLRAMLVGGGPVPPDLMQRARERGYPVLHTYGLTEACSQVTTESLGAADGHTAGVALEGTSIRVSPEGELQVRGPTVMRGYFNDLAATARAFTEDGWLRTGDLGALDERGRLTVFSRRTDLIVSGGENVYPAEIEAVLSSHPDVLETAVTALPDARWGQIPAALFVRRAPATTSTPNRYPQLPEALAAWCRERLAGFKVPKRFAEVPALPRTANGKVDRKALQAVFGERT